MVLPGIPFFVCPTSPAAGGEKFKAKCCWESDGSVVISEACWLDPSRHTVLCLPNIARRRRRNFLERSVVGNQMARLRLGCIPHAPGHASHGLHARNWQVGRLPDPSCQLPVANFVRCACLLMPRRAFWQLGLFLASGLWCTKGDDRSGLKR